MLCSPVRSLCSICSTARWRIGPAVDPTGLDICVPALILLSPGAAMLWHAADGDALRSCGDRTARPASAARRARRLLEGQRRLGPAAVEGRRRRTKLADRLVAARPRRRAARSGCAGEPPYSRVASRCRESRRRRAPTIGTSRSSCRSASISGGSICFTCTRSRRARLSRLPAADERHRSVCMLAWKQTAR